MAEAKNVFAFDADNAGRGAASRVWDLLTDVDLPRHPDGKLHFVRVTGEFGDDGRYHVRPVAAQGSHQLAATALAQALAVVADGDGVPAGGEVAVLLLRC